ncbi:MAG: hypothetical protein F4Y44_11780 [Chloroflexi bacterium]|nr:hypothetical protein [Chloroflexota bacterium]
MDEQTKQSVMKALDNALTTVAIREYNRLSYRLLREQVADITKNALNSLGKLQSGNIPDYGDWVALFYHWYQPSQINLAYSMIKSTAIVSDRLRVLDYGCGALAMQFGVALATADALEEMQSISEIRIDSLDTSQAMVEMGQKIWEQFKIEASKDSNLRYVSLACEIINPQIILLTNLPSMIGVNSNTAWATAWQSECWLGALHAVYDDNRDNVQRWLNSIVDRLNPDICFATTHSSKDYLIREVWDFIDYAEYYLPELTIESQFRGMLPEITQWRINLNTALQINHHYLNRPVTWEWPEAAFMIHTKYSEPTDADDLPW